MKRYCPICEGYREAHLVRNFKMYNRKHKLGYKCKKCKAIIYVEVTHE